MPGQVARRSLWRRAAAWPIRLLRAGVAAARMTFNGYGGGGGYGWRQLLPGSQYDYEAAAGDLWRQTAVAACLRWVKINFPEPALEVVRELKDGKKEVIPAHPAARLLSRPNRYYGRYTFWAACSLSWIVDGNVYIRKVRSGAGKVVELWWIPHWMIWPRWKTDGSEFIGYYEYNVNGRLEKIPVDDIIHLRNGVDPRDERRGMSELKHAVRAVCGLNECDTYTAAILRNMGIPGLIISPGAPDVTLMDDDIDVFKNQFRESYTSENRGDPLVGTRMFKVEKVSMTPEELRLDKLPARLEDQICAVIGVPAMCVGLSSGALHKTYANYGEARRAAYEDCLIPTQKAMAEELTIQLLEADFEPNTSFRWNYAEVQCLAESENEVAERVGKLYHEHQVIKRAEAREALGFEFDEDDEVYYDDAKAAAAPALPAPDPGKPAMEPAPGGADDENDQGDENERTATGALKTTVEPSRFWSKIEDVLQRIEDAIDARHAH